MKSIVRWFVGNPIAGNLLTLVLVLGGLMTLRSIHQEEFPSVDTQIVNVRVPYLGATPEEVERAVCVRIEEAIDGMPGIDRFTARASEGICTVFVELLPDTSTTWAQSEIESKINGITTFPAETEKPVVSYFVLTQDVLRIAVSGDADERTLKTLSRKLRDDLAGLPEISQVDVDYIRLDEISIEVSEHTLRRYGLTFDEVVAAVRNSSIDLPGGSLKTDGGEILLRSEGQAYEAADFEDIVVLTRPDGTVVTLGEIGQVRDAFEDTDLRAFFNGRPAAMIQVNQVGQESLLEVAAAAHAFVEKARERMPPGIDLVVWKDEAVQLRGRINALVRNAVGGLAFVLVVLALVLRFRLALWVSAGIPISLFGAIMLFPAMGFSISTLAIMGFILVLGIVVDDAIVVGERIHAYEQKGLDPRDAAVEGTADVLVPVVFGVLTTVVAFSPLLLVPGRFGAFFKVLGGTVVLCLFFSLFEALLILPTHIAHRKHDGVRDESRRWIRVQDAVSGAMERFAKQVYQPALERVLEWRYLAAAVALSIMIMTIALFASGRIGVQFFPGIDSNRLSANLTMPQGTPLGRTERAVRNILAAAEEIEDEWIADGGEPLIVHSLSSVGRQMSTGGPPRSSSGGGSHVGHVLIEMVDEDDRSISTEEFTQRWRERVGGVPDAEELTYERRSMHMGSAIGLELGSEDYGQAIRAAEELRHALARYDGVFDISDSFRAGKQEMKLRLHPEAESLGVTLADVARQVRAAFYGVEAQRVQRGPEDVRVMVRYPESERRSVGDLEDMWIRRPDGSQVPLSAVAEVDLGRGFANIARVDGRSVITVTADVDRQVVTPEDVLSSLQAGMLPELQQKYPGLTWGLEGEQRERTKAMSGLFRAFVLALMIIYALLAIPLGSYTQPLIIMAAIPFGAVGAVLGHFIMGWDLVFFSLLGVVALAGVVVNDSLVLVDFVNREQSRGASLEEAVRTAGATRFRAIFLTSLTTFAGLVPLMFNVSEATFFVVPIAISLAFGVLLATAVTLFIVPCGCLIAEDLTTWIGRSRKETPDPVESATPS